MSWSLYWAHNDGMRGHVWLSEGDLRALADEMIVQGMAWPTERLPAPGEPQMRVEVDEIESLLDAAAPEPMLLADAGLWRDWLAFLEGATANGGLLIRS
jgi:hypothetical protein